MWIEDDGSSGLETRSCERACQGQCHTLREVGYIAWAVRISSICPALVENLISLLLSHAQSNTTHPTLYVLPSTVSHTLHTANPELPRGGTIAESARPNRVHPHPVFALPSSSHKRSTLAPCALNSGREACVWERTVVTLVEARPIKCVSVDVFLYLSLLAHVHYAIVARAKVREVLR